jgi:RNA polymerase sigma-70 factor (family 1)
MNNRKFSSRAAPLEELNFFEELFRLYYPRLKNYACQLLHESGEAEDLVQDVFCQVWHNRTRLNEEKNVGAYLFTLLKNKCFNVLRHKVIEKRFAIQKVRYESEALYHISFKETGEFVSMEERLFNELEQIIAGMPPKCRRAFRLKWFEEKKNREIAEIMKISTTMVDKHLAKGLQVARQKLNPDLLFLFLARFSED